MEKIKVLLLIDVQRDFIDMSLANPDAQACIPGIVNKVDNVLFAQQVLLYKEFAFQATEYISKQSDPCTSNT